LKLQSDRKRSYGHLSTYVNDFYKVFFFSDGQGTEKNPAGKLEKIIAKSDKGLPDLQVILTRTDPQPEFIYGIDENLGKFITYDQIDSYIEQLKIGKETLAEIQRVTKEKLQNEPAFKSV